MAPLSPTAIVELLDSCDQLVRQREQILTVLDDLAQSWTTVRSALNELHLPQGGIEFNERFAQQARPADAFDAWCEPIDKGRFAGCIGHVFLRRRVVFGGRNDSAVAVRTA
jgi:hypothetical protein